MGGCTLKNLHNAILKYLYINDNGDFIDLYSRFVKGKITKKRVNEIIVDLNDYLEKERPSEKQIIEVPRNITSSHIYLQAKLNVRINQKGREKYENFKNGIIAENINKRIALFTLMGVLVSVLISFTPSIINEIHKKAEVIPAITLKINNSTQSEISFFHYQDFYLWFPGDEAYHLVGKYEIINNNDNIKLPSGVSYITAKVLDNGKYYNYLKTSEYSISFSIRSNNGLNISDDLLPFSVEAINKYAPEIIIK